MLSSCLFLSFHPSYNIFQQRLGINCMQKNNGRGTSSVTLMFEKHVMCP